MRRLEKAHGRPVWRPGAEPVDVLIGTILSQNTTGANSSTGLDALKRTFPRWELAADAPVAKIRRCIRSCGLARIKAPRIRNILRRIRDDRGEISLGFLAEGSWREGYEYLLAFNGVGPKTALCVGLFAFGMEVFPVDTHIYRIACRLGMLDGAIPPARAHEVLTEMIPPKQRYALHVLLIAHGRAVCRARKPRCDDCVLLSLCPHGERATGR